MATVLRRRLVVTVLVAALSGAVLTACGGADGAPVATAGAQPAGWVRLPPSPLSARENAAAVWVGGRVLVLGGDTTPCPPNASCVAAPAGTAPREAAAYDPGTATWTRIADPPVDVAFPSTVVVGDRLYLWQQDWAAEGVATGAFLTYDAAADRWRTLATPDVGRTGLALTAAGSAVEGYRQSHELGREPDLRYDPAADAWTPLPRDPFPPMFDRTLVGLEDGRTVLLGTALVENPGGPEPSLYEGAVLDPARTTWTRPVPSEVVASGPVWIASGGLVVNPSQGTLDGGEVNNWGRDYRTGGAFDPDGGRWLAVPEHAVHYGWSGAPTAGPGFVAVRPWLLRTPSLQWERMDDNPALEDRSGSAETWAGDRLFVWGGVRYGEGTGPGELHDDGWTWRPAG
ncbi:hypothetical protein [Kineosporia sp. A_224]|uniref:hypothetical protein n=1 Tax=Kineosporia sp. A_224 TaxID=1962180 RepID=UPI000B4B1801|nr:hypothetical protein [Kineosporia sp. A_224]